MSFMTKMEYRILPKVTSKQNVLETSTVWKEALQIG